MELILHINIDNAAFDDGASGREVASILDDVAIEVEELDLRDGFHITLRDDNGNVVGKAYTR